jgi:ComF family protein
VKGFCRFLIDSVFPRRCVSCESFTGGSLVCDLCRLRLLRAESPGLLEWRGGIKVYSPFLTCDVLLDLIRFLKFEGGTAAAGLLGWEMSMAYRGELRNPVIVPVPLHWTRLARRGYDQAGLLAAEVSRRTGAPLGRRVLGRKKRTHAQSSLDHGARRGNMTGAFRLRRADHVRERDVILVDDLVTTGETVMACCRALESGRPSSVTVLCAGRRRTAKIKVERHDCHMFE